MQFDLSLRRHGVSLADITPIFIAFFLYFKFHY
jgi:hypothetical protein